MSSNRITFKLILGVFLLALWGITMLVIRVVTGKPWPVISNDKKYQRYFHVVLVVVPLLVFLILFLFNNGYLNSRY